MLPDTVRLSQPTKEQLLRLKRSTGIKQWNVLSRWAFCTSMNDARQLPLLEHANMSNVEMSWKVFAGPHADAYGALLRYDGLRRLISDVELGALLQAHIRRGVGTLLLAQPRIEALVRSPHGH